MQASKIVTGGEYATSRSERVRITGEGKRILGGYRNQPNTQFPCVLLNSRTGEEVPFDASNAFHRGLAVNDTRDGHVVTSRDLVGPWADYAAQVQAEIDRKNADQQARDSYRDELIAMMDAHGFDRSQYTLSIYSSRGACSANVRLPEKPPADDTQADASMPTLTPPVSGS